MGTVAGPVLGALILEPGAQYFIQEFPNDFLSQIVFGALFVAVILLLLRGVISRVGEKVTSWRMERSGHPAARVTGAAARPSAERSTTAGEESMR